MVSPPDSDNGRITLATLGANQVMILAAIDRMQRTIEADHDRGTRTDMLIIGMCDDIADNKKAIKDNRDDLQDLNRRDKTWNGLNTLAALIATGIGFWSHGQ